MIGDEQEGKKGSGRAKPGGEDGEDGEREAR